MPISPQPYPGELDFLASPELVLPAQKAMREMVPYLKYIDPDERDEFMQLSQREQTRDLLLQNLQLILELGGGKIIEGAAKIVKGKAISPVFKKTFPKTTKRARVVADSYTPEYITDAVIVMKDGKIFKGQSHHIAYEKVKVGQESMVFDADSFITNKGRVLSREEAVKLTGIKTEDAADIIGKSIPDEYQVLPKYAGSVNLEKQIIERDLKLAELRAAEGMKASKKTWTEVDIDSAKIMKDPEKIAKPFEKWKRGKMLDIVEQDVVRKANVEGVYNFQKDVASARTVEEANSILEKYRQSRFIPASEIASEQGRMLQSYNKEIGLNRLGKAYSKLEKGLKPHQLDELKKLDLDDPSAVDSFVRKLDTPKLRDYVYEYWYNSILSGIPTHVVNVASNTGWRMFQVPHRGLTAAVDKTLNVFLGRARTRYMNEMVPMMTGMIKGKPKAAKSAWQMLRKGQITEFETKWAREMGSAVGAFDRSPNRIVRGAGKVLTIPTKGLRAMDVYANSLAYDAQMKALARRVANIKKMPKADFPDFEKKFIADPPKWAHDEAMEFAKYSTFMSDPGAISSAIIRLRDAAWGTPRFIIPFVNTIGNLLKRGVEMTPGIGLGLARGQNASEVIAKQIEGLIIGAFVYSKFDKGEIIGAAPQNKAERERFYAQGKKPWSMKVGNSWVQYRRVEPFNTVIASTSIFYDGIKKSMAEGNDEKTEQLLYSMANEFKNNLIDSSYLQGVSQLLNRHGNFEAMPKRTVATLIPYSGFWRSVNRSYEAAVEGSAKYRPSDTWVGAFANVLPGLHDLKKPQINVWGKDIELEGGMFRQWLPYKWAKVTDDKVELFLEKIEKYPGLPSQMVSNRGVMFKLDDDIYRDFVIAGGNDAYKIIEKKIDYPKWRQKLRAGDSKWLQGRIESIMNDTWRKYRRKAKNEQLKRNSLEE